MEKFAKKTEIISFKRRYIPFTDKNRSFTDKKNCQRIVFVCLNL